MTSTNASPPTTRNNADQDIGSDMAEHLRNRRIFDNGSGELPAI